MPKETLSDLFDKFLRDEMSPEEFTRFQALVADERNKEALDHLVGGAFADRKHLAKERTTEKGERTTGTVRRLRYAAAACAAGAALIMGAYGLLHHRDKPQAMIAHVASSGKVTLPPGGNKAILTLADGSTVDLGSAGNGLVTQQGNTRVVKLDGGRLDYTRGATSHGAVVYNTVTTPRGGQYQIVLPDGTTVWLNAASSLRFPTAFTARDRTVELDGEAYFEVKGSHAAPFIVQAGVVKVEALGTRFDVMAYKDEPAFKASLVQGSVRVSNGAHQTLLQPGFQAVLPDRGNGTLTTGSADWNEVLAWKNNKFWLEDADIGSIMRQVSRWYDVDVQIKGTLPDVRLSGSVSRKEDAGELLDLLEESTGIHFIADGRKIIVTTKNQ